MWGFIFGQFAFFWAFEKRFLNRIFGEEVRETRERLGISKFLRLPVTFITCTPLRYSIFLVPCSIFAFVPTFFHNSPNSWFEISNRGKK